MFDTSPKARLPAYTDSILFLSADGDGIQATEYTSHPRIMLSDHKPVSVTLRVALCKDSERHERPSQLLPILPKEETRPMSVGGAVGDAVTNAGSAFGKMLGSLQKRWSSEELEVPAPAKSAGAKPGAIN